MTFNFDLAAAINKIAELEAAITTPTPGITNAYTYGNNPSVIEDPTALPAVVHVPLGPRDVEVLSNTTWQCHYDLYSRVLFIESLANKYPSDESAANLIWKSVAETFLNDTNRRAICTASGALAYICMFDVNSYTVRPWPPMVDAPHAYWSLQYIHRFTVLGG